MVGTFDRGLHVSRYSSWRTSSRAVSRECLRGGEPASGPVQRYRPHPGNDRDPSRRAQSGVPVDVGFAADAVTSLAKPGELFPLSPNETFRRHDEAAAPQRRLSPDGRRLRRDVRRARRSASPLGCIHPFACPRWATRNWPAAGKPRGSAFAKTASPTTSMAIRWGWIGRGIWMPFR